MGRRTLATIVVLAALTPVARAADRAPVWSPDAGRIAYLSGSDLVVARVDGTRQTRVSRRVDSFSWSSDGRRLLFRSGHAVWTAHPDGSRKRFVGESFHDPAWAPDGTHVVYVAEQTDGATIVLAAPDGSNRTEIYDIKGRCIEERSLLTAPSSGRIAFSCVQQSFYPFGYAYTFVVIDVRLGTVRALDVLGLPVSWSPDGQRVAVLALKPTPDPSDYELQIEIFDLRSGNSRILGSAADAVFAPSWTHAALVGDDGAHVIEISTGRLTRAPAVFSPTWSVSGALAFVRRGAIWRARASGRGAVRLGAGAEPAWSPAGRALAFVRGGHIWRMRADGTAKSRVS